MAEVRDIARIRDISGRSIDQEIPDVEDPDSLRDAAELVYRKLVNDKLTSASPERKRNGLPGRRWQGRIQSEVFFKLWPRLADSMLVSETRSREITGEILGYLTGCGMLHCEQGTTKFNAAVWWISDHWTPMGIRHAGDQAAQNETVSEERPETVLATVRCRVCDAACSSVQARGGHEYSTHRVVVGADGVVYSFDDPSYTPRYIMDALLRILGVAEKPLTFNAISGLAYDIDPRMGKPDVRKALDTLEEFGTACKSMKGAYTVYEITSQEASPEAWGTVVQENALVGEVSAAGGVAPAPVDFTSSVEFVRHIVLTARGGLDKALEAVGEMARYAAAKDQEIASLKTRLVGASSSSELARLKQELVNITEERDAYKAKLDNLSKALSGLGVK